MWIRDMYIIHSKRLYFITFNTEIFWNLEFALWLLGNNWWIMADYTRKKSRQVDIFISELAPNFPNLHSFLGQNQGRIGMYWTWRNYLAVLLLTFFFLKNTGEYKVKLLVYSGLPDPFWSIHPRHEKFKEIKELLEDARVRGIAYRHEHAPAILGYRGFLLHHPQAEHVDLILGRETTAL